MSLQTLLSKCLRMMLFAVGVSASVLIISSVLLHPVSRAAFANMFLVASLVIIQTGCAWLLRKLRVWSGALATQIMPAGLVTSPATFVEGEGKGHA